MYRGELDRAADQRCDARTAGAMEEHSDISDLGRLGWILRSCAATLPRSVWSRPARAFHHYQSPGKARGLSHGGRVRECAEIYGRNVRAAESGRSGHHRERPAGCLQLSANTSTAVSAVAAAV